MSQLYAYSPLAHGANSIRLLRLWPDAREAEIRCELFDYDLGNTGTSHLYEALSYVWGDAQQKKRIFIDSKHCTSGHHRCHVEVTSNLHEALLNIRDRTIPRILWIDALCINQQDVEERGRQVRFMTSIYSSASRVIVWLGAESPGMSAAFQLIRNSASSFQRKSNAALVEEGPLLFEEGAVQKEPDDITDIEQKGMQTLLNRPWFKRVWEVAAAQFVVVVCGQQQLSGHVFAQGLRGVLRSTACSPALRAAHNSIAYLIEWQPIKSSQPALGILPLGELLDVFHSHEATDPRDEVYAMMGMRSDPQLYSGLDIDYRLPLEYFLQKLIYHILSPKATVATWRKREIAMIGVKGCPFGRITKVESGVTYQTISIDTSHFRPAALATVTGSTWTIRNTAKHVFVGDILVAIEGSRQLSIVRAYVDYFAIIVIATQPPENWWLTSPLHEFPQISVAWSEFSTLLTKSQYEFLLVWNWKPETMEASNHLIAEFIPASTFEHPLWTEYGTELRRLVKMGKVFDDLEDWEAIDQIVKRAVSSVWQNAPPSEERAYMSNLNELHTYWDEYVLLRGFVNRPIWTIWFVTEGFPSEYSPKNILRYYQTKGCVQPNVEEILAFTTQRKNQQLHFGGLWKARDMYDPDYGFDKLSVFCERIFPNYAHLPQSSKLGWGNLQGPERFITKIVLHAESTEDFLTESTTAMLTYVFKRSRSGQVERQILDLLLAHCESVHSQTEEGISEELLMAFMSPINHVRFWQKPEDYPPVLLRLARSEPRLAYAILKAMSPTSPAVSREGFSHWHQFFVPSAADLAYCIQNTSLIRYSVHSDGGKMVKNIYSLFSSNGKYSYFNSYLKRPDAFADLRQSVRNGNTEDVQLEAVKEEVLSSIENWMRSHAGIKNREETITIDHGLRT